MEESVQNSLKQSYNACVEAEHSTEPYSNDTGYITLESSSSCIFHNTKVADLKQVYDNALKLSSLKPRALKML